MARPRTTSDEAVMRAISRHITENLTLAAVAAEVGLSPATLLQRFGSKRGLLLAVSKQARVDALALFERAREGSDSPLGALHAALGGLASGVRSPKELANSIGFLQLDITDPEFHEHAAAYARQMDEEIKTLIRAAIKAGELADSVDPHQLPRSVQVAYNGVVIPWSVEVKGERRRRSPCKRRPVAARTF